MLKKLGLLLGLLLLPALALAQESFPTSPTDGQTYSANGRTWQYGSTLNAWTVVASGSGPGIKVQTFTSSGTYTPSAGMVYAIIECVGAGGAGGGAAQSSGGAAVGGGGGGGAYARALVTAAQVGTSQTVTVATGGTAGSVGNNAGNSPSGDTSVGALCVAKSGSGGSGSSASLAGGGTGGAGGSGSSSTGDFKTSGEAGRNGSGGTILTYFAGASGAGGAAGLGFGGSSNILYSSTGAAGQNYGGGGSGGASYNNSASVAGGPGANGIVVITEFIAGGWTPNNGPICLTAQATTSGTAFDFTGIPAGVKRITVVLNGVSLSGTDSLLVQIGTSGGLETSSYDSASLLQNTTPNSAILTSTSGYILQGGNSANTNYTNITLLNISGNIWVGSWAGKVSSTAAIMGSGTKTLSAVLDRVRITRSGTDTFDAGSVNVCYE